MNCVACGERYEDHGRFCPFCGIVLQITCSHCGQLNDRAQTVCSCCRTTLSKPVEPTPAAVPPGRPLERRQLTIMFTDLVNSTALSDRLDPEDFRVLIEAHRTAAVARIKRYDGVVARYLGDGMLIYFGYPEAHEDDPDRAVRAGLEIVDATKAMNERWVGEGRGKIAVRIGIHTGIVVVGDVIKQDVQEPMAVFGSAPSLAARLQALAEPNSVVLSHATKMLLRPTIRCEPRGQMVLKGIARSVEIYTASDSKGPVIADPAADRKKNVLPFVNREKELAALRLGWASARKGEGKAILLAGDPGIGKSRLIRAVEERVVAAPFRWLVARASPYATNSDFFAFSELFHGLLQPEDPENTKAEGYALLSDVLGEQKITDPNHELGFAHLLGIEIPKDATPHHLQPERLRDLTLSAIIAWFEQESKRNPLVLVIEDLHWADASTLETIRLLLTRLASTRILLIMSSRDHSVLGDVGEHVQTLSIERLPPDYAKTLLDHVVLDAGLPQTALDTLLERANGVPLFLEELPKPALEGGRPAGLVGSDDPIVLPATLRDSLMAQLDRLGVGKAVAQTGAVLGHSFEEKLMRRVFSGGLQQMEEGLAALADAGLLTRHGSPPDAFYAFKHALLAEIAYDSLLRQERRQIHRRTADALVAHFPALTETRPELIARHYAAARDAIVAFDYWMKAGKAAARRSANTEAIGHLRSAEAELETLKAAGIDGTNSRYLELLLIRGPVLIALLGWSADEVEKTYRSALSISEAIGVDDREIFSAWGGLYNVYLLRGDLKSARSSAQKLFEIANRNNERGLKISSHTGASACSFLAGEFRDSIKYIDDAITLNETVDQKSKNSTNPAVIAFSFKAWSHWFLGESEKANQAILGAIKAAELVRHPFSNAHALCLASSLAQCDNRCEEALEYAGKAMDLSVKHAFPYWRSWACVVKGWAKAMLGNPDEGIALLSEGIAGFKTNNSAQMKGYNLCLLAEAHLSAGHWQDVVDTAKAALSDMERTGIVFYKAEVYRLLGEGLAEIGDQRRLHLRMITKGLRLAERQNALPLYLKLFCALFQRYEDARLRKVIWLYTKDMLERVRANGAESDILAANRQLEAALAAHSQIQI